MQRLFQFTSYHILIYQKLIYHKMQKYLNVSIILTGMAQIKMTNLVKVYALLLLKKRPMHGYELIKELEAYMLREISAAHVYPFLKMLQKNKLITLKELGKREKKQYKLTKAGNKFAQELINKFAGLIELSITRNIKTCTHCNCKIVEGWHKEKINGEALIFCCSRCADAFKKRSN